MNCLVAGCNQPGALACFDGSCLQGNTTHAQTYVCAEHRTIKNEDGRYVLHACFMDAKLKPLFDSNPGLGALLRSLDQG
jgi:hypothetical protein